MDSICSTRGFGRMESNKGAHWEDRRSSSLEATPVSSNKVVKGLYESLRFSNQLNPEDVSRVFREETPPLYVEETLAVV